MKNFIRWYQYYYIQCMLIFLMLFHTLVFFIFGYWESNLGPCACDISAGTPELDTQPILCLLKSAGCDRLSLSQNPLVGTDL